MEDYKITGQKISEIPNNEYPTKNSLFYVVQSSGQLSSENIKYANLSARIVVDVIEALGLGSMAHEEKYLYSLSSHNHDKLYSKVSIKDLYQGEEDKVLSIANITIQNNDDISTYHLVTPRIQTYQYDSAKKGTLKFVAVNNNVWTLKQYNDGKYNIDVDDEDFDGWVFPNGGYLDTIDYQLPDLSKFLKIQNSKSQRVPYKNALKAHSHDYVHTELSMLGTLDMYRCWVPTTRRCGTDGSTGHNGGCENKTSANIVVDFSKAIIRDKYTENPNSEYMIETKPYHNLMPVMIYIGTKNDEEDGQDNKSSGGGG